MKKNIISMLLVSAIMLPCVAYADGIVQNEKNLIIESTYDAPMSGTVISALYLDGKLVKVQDTYATNTTQLNISFDNTQTKHYDKAKIFVWNNGVASAPDVKEISVMPTNHNPFAEDEEINVVFLGDSLYNGSGVRESRRFVTQVGRWFQKHYQNEKTKVNFYNEGAGGTTTEYSLARLVRDAINHDPDVVFVALTCNDEIDTATHVESIVKSLNALENPPYIIFTHIPNKGKMTTYKTAYEVAKYYGIPIIDPSEMLRRVVTFGITENSMWRDNAHPSELGHDVISDEIMNCLETYRYLQKPIKHTESLYNDSVTFIPNTFESNSSTDETKFTRTGTWDSTGGVLTATEPGSTLEFTFSGNVLAFEYGLKVKGGILEVYVDDKLVMECDSWYGTVDSHQIVCKHQSAVFNLPDGEHKVVMKVVPNAVRDENGKVTEEINTTVNYRLDNIITGSVID